MQRDYSTDFPLLAQQPQLAYLDSGATAQRPSAVLDAHRQFDEELNAPVGRSLYPLANQATDAYEAARKRMSQFFGASDERSMVWTSGTTMGVNLVAHAWARKNLGKDDIVVTTMLEHHANIVPWQIMAQETGIKLHFVPLTADGRLNMDDLEQVLRTRRVKLVTVTHVSNVTATLNPISRIASMAHDFGAAIMVDGAQAAGHLPVNVERLGVDFYAFSGHKMLGFKGTGMLYVTPSRFDEMGVMFGGGDMISRVTTERAWYKPMPIKLEAGTQNVGGAIALAAAADYLETYPRGLRGVERHVRDLGTYAWERLAEIPNIKLIGPGPVGNHSAMSLVSFTFDHNDCPNRQRITDMNLAIKLGEMGVAVRSGIFCAQPVLDEHFGLPAGATRASFHLYNKRSHVDQLVDGTRRIVGV